MWLVFAIVALFSYAIADIFGKKTVSDGDELTPIELCISCSLLSLIISIILFAFKLGESGMSPWQLLQSNPLIIINSLCFFLQWVTYLFSMRYMDLSITEAISGSTGIFYFIGMVLINLIFGKLPSTREMFHPLRLIPIILVIICIFIYPNIERFTKQKKNISKEDSRKANRSFIIGFCLLLMSLLLDSLDSLITALVIDEGTIGTIDYFMTSYFATIVPVIVFSIFYRVKKKKWFVPIKDKNTSFLVYCIVAFASSVLYVISSFHDAVRTGIIFLIYPIIPIVGAKIFLKEKHSWKQNLCIWIIALSAIVFCVSDYLL